METNFRQLAKKYSDLRVAVVGDFCLDRYLLIDPRKAEKSIETGLPVHNVVSVRAQPGGAGTILNNLVALGAGAIYPVGFCGEDGEGFELKRALSQKGVRLDHFQSFANRRTFTYCKPLLVESGREPRELSRLDSKNWTPTPPSLGREIAQSVQALARTVDAMVVLDQVDIPGTGVVGTAVLRAVATAAKARPGLLILADSRRGLKKFPPVCFKMNRAELSALSGSRRRLSMRRVADEARAMALRNGRPVFVTLSEDGILGATPDGEVARVSSIPTRGTIDIVGAGDAVTANLSMALAAGASLETALAIANAAASVVIHQLGTTGTASVGEIRRLLSRP